MPYRSNQELPPAVRRLPQHAQDIYREAFNHAWDRYDGDPTCHRIAWAAVENCYAKVDGAWVRNEPAHAR